MGGPGHAARIWCGGRERQGQQEQVGTTSAPDLKTEGKT